MLGPEEWPSSGSNPADRIRLTGPAATNLYLQILAQLRTQLSRRCDATSIIRQEDYDLPSPCPCPENCNPRDTGRWQLGESSRITSCLPTIHELVCRRYESSQSSP